MTLNEISLCLLKLWEQALQILPGDDMKMFGLLIVLLVSIQN